MARPGGRLGVAVSGGADSVCLLDVLCLLGFDIQILHLNHGLRGAESDADEEFVRELGRRRGLPVHAERWTGPPVQGNLEQAMRAARYGFFRRMMDLHGLQRTATGHTLSDQAETVLLRIARGAGPPGLCGIHPVTRAGVIRPLLEVSRQETRDHLRAQGLPWRQDASNEQLRWRRNLVRKSLLPRLAEALNPEVELALARLAELAWDDEQYWQEEVARRLDGLHLTGPPFVVAAALLGEHPPALGRRMVRGLLSLAAGGTRRFTLEHIHAVWRLIGREKGSGRVRLPGVEVWRSLGWLRLSRDHDQRPLPPEPQTLAGPGEALVAGLRIRADLGEGGSGAGACLETAELDAGFPLVVRGWRPGDVFQPASASNEMKMKEIFARLGVPSWDRPHWPMIEWKGRIAWCRSLGAAAWARPVRAEGPRLQIRVFPAG